MTELTRKREEAAARPTTTTRLLGIPRPVPASLQPCAFTASSAEICWAPGSLVMFLT